MRGDVDPPTWRPGSAAPQGQVREGTPRTGGNVRVGCAKDVVHTLNLHTPFCFSLRSHAVSGALLAAPAPPSFFSCFRALLFCFSSCSSSSRHSCSSLWLSIYCARSGRGGCACVRLGLPRREVHCRGHRRTDLYRKSGVLALLSVGRGAAVGVLCFEVPRITSVPYTRSQDCAPRAHLLCLQR